LTDDLKKLLENNLYVLQALHKRGDLDETSYCKGIVCVAYEFALNGGIPTAVSLLSGLPERYYRTAMREQLSADTAFWEVGDKLAILLVEAGFAGLESDDLKPTQAPAKA
jgi:hypothetical protein